MNTGRKPSSSLDQPLARPVDVGQPQARGRHPVGGVVHEVQLLAGQLGDPVDVDRAGRVQLVDGRLQRPAVDLAGRRVHDPRRRVDAPQRLEERGVAHRVELEVAQRVAHRREVADLSGEVEHDVGVGHGVGDDVVADLGLDDLDIETVEVAAIAAVPFDERVDDAHGAPRPTSAWARLEPMNRGRR